MTTRKFCDICDTHIAEPFVPTWRNYSEAQLLVLPPDRMFNIYKLDHVCFACDTHIRNFINDLRKLNKIS